MVRGMVETVEFRERGEGMHMSVNVLTKMACRYVCFARRFSARAALAK